MKIKLSVEEHAKLERDYPNAIITRLGEVEYNVEGVPQQVLNQFKQGEVQVEQPVQLQSRKLQQPLAQPSQPSQDDLASIMRTFIKSTAQPLLEGSLDELKRQIDDKVQADIADLSNQIEDLANKVNTFTIDTTRRLDEFTNLLNQQKQLQLEEVKQVLSKLANLNKYLKDIPQI